MILYYVYVATVFQVSHVGEDVEGIPSQLVVKFAKTAKRLDLSYNRIK